jgi:hypothetical protein
MDQLRASIACAAPVSCIHLLGGTAAFFWDRFADYRPPVSSNPAASVYAASNTHYSCFDSRTVCRTVRT